MALSDTRSKLVARLHHRKTREREGLVLVEGPNAVSEALTAGASLRFAIASERFDPDGGGEVLSRLVHALPREVEDLHRVDGRELARLADTETPQGILLVAEQPDSSLARIASESGGRWLVLDAVQDPGNVGTLIRAAAAFACTGVLALDGTADPWGTKAVRASAGTVFRLPVVTVSRAELDGALNTLPTPLLIAQAGGASPGSGEGGQWSLVLGNEGAGIREELRIRADSSVAIPMPGGVESLNVGVAGAILLYALTLGVSPDSPPEPTES